MGKIEKEKQIISLMIEIYCEKNHADSGGLLCDECQSLHEYADQRLTRCQFGDDKSSCRKCPLHCYKKDMKQKVKAVMKFSGPRLLFYRPIEFIKHWFY